MSGAAGDILKPGEWELVYAPPDSSREAEGYALCDALRKLSVLANGVEKGIE